MSLSQYDATRRIQSLQRQLDRLTAEVEPRLNVRPEPKQDYQLALSVARSSLNAQTYRADALAELIDEATEALDKHDPDPELGKDEELPARIERIIDAEEEVSNDLQARLEVALERNREMTATLAHVTTERDEAQARVRKMLEERPKSVEQLENQLASTQDLADRLQRRLSSAFSLLYPVTAAAEGRKLCPTERAAMEDDDE